MAKARFKVWDPANESLCSSTVEHEAFDARDAAEMYAKDDPDGAADGIYDNGYDLMTRDEDGVAVAVSGDSIPLPEPMYHLLARIVEVLVRGDAVTIVPVGKELTTQQAADVLNVSRQYLVRLLEGGKLAHRKTGKHRRVRVEDVLAFKAERDSERAKQLDDLAAMTQDFGGYPELE